MKDKTKETTNATPLTEGYLPEGWVATQASIVIDPVIEAITEMEQHHASTNQDKYAATDIQLYPKDLFMSDAHGKSINIFNAVKYLSRYLSEGFEKSNNREDIKKAIHYLLFELARTK